MVESHVISGLKTKRAEIERAIIDYEDKAKAARADLVTINQALAIFGEFTGNPRRYFERNKIFERGELMRIIMDALREAPDGLTTRDIAIIAMNVKGLDIEDGKLLTRVAHRIGNALASYRRSGQVISEGSANGVQIWRRAS